MRRSIRFDDALYRDEPGDRSVFGEIEQSLSSRLPLGGVYRPTMPTFINTSDERGKYHFTV